MKSQLINEFRTELKRFGKVVIWGLRTQKHTHRYIHQAYMATLRALDIPVLWVDDRAENNALVAPGDLVIAVNVAGRFLKPHPAAYFCLHNFPPEFHAEFPFHRQLRLQVYTRSCLPGSEQLAPAVRFRASDRTLFQPWGTDLLPWNFYPPVTAFRLPVVFWIGSIWNNVQNQGNLNEIAELKRILLERRVLFAPLKNIPTRLAIPLIRASRIAPAIAGAWQVSQDYLPCRLFKNVSYGHVGITNVSGFREIFGDDHNVVDTTIAACVARGIDLAPADYADLCRAQQAHLTPYTYLAALQRIATTFDRS